jgi:CRISPR-associated protein Csb3
MDFGRVLPNPPEYCSTRGDDQKTVEPFYFDTRRFTNALHVGFSLDVHEMDTVAHPAVELLCLVGLQRFRPASSDKGRTHHYGVWGVPLPPSVASSVVGGGVAPPGCRTYRFAMLARDAQNRYKAFGPSTLIGGQ